MTGVFLKYEDSNLAILTPAVHCSTTIDGGSAGWHPKYAVACHATIRRGQIEVDNRNRNSSR